MLKGLHIHTNTQRHGSKVPCQKNQGASSHPVGRNRHPKQFFAFPQVVPCFLQLPQLHSPIRAQNAGSTLARAPRRKRSGEAAEEAERSEAEELKALSMAMAIACAIQTPAMAISYKYSSRFL